MTPEALPFFLGMGGRNSKRMHTPALEAAARGSRFRRPRFEVRGALQRVFLPGCIFPTATAGSMAGSQAHPARYAAQSNREHGAPGGPRPTSGSERRPRRCVSASTVQWCGSSMMARRKTRADTAAALFRTNRSSCTRCGIRTSPACRGRAGSRRSAGTPRHGLRRIRA